MNKNAEAVLKSKTVEPPQSAPCQKKIRKKISSCYSKRSIPSLIMPQYMHHVLEKGGKWCATQRQHDAKEG